MNSLPARARAADAPFASEQDVLKLEVSVTDVLVVRVAHCRDDLVRREKARRVMAQKKGVA